MRILGIDYGVKRVGLALSDENSKMAFPYGVLKNNAKILDDLKKIIKKEKIKLIILGLPFGLDGRETHNTKPTEEFKKKLEKEISIPIIFEKEFYTTKEAERVQGKIKHIDASAAALILKHYLDKLKIKI